MAQVTAIIPTLCSRSRSKALLRAIDSLLYSSAEPPTVIVVINGNQCDERVAAQISARSGVHVERIATPSAPAAQLHGRRLVETEFFCFLDDDDEYLPGGLDLRIGALLISDQCGVVVTNGLRRLWDGTEQRALGKLDGVSTDPMAALLEQNWMTSCGALFRSSSVPTALFENYHDYIEWTWLGFRLAHAGIQVCAIDQPTFIINETDGSASKSEQYLLSHVSLYERMLKSTSRKDIRRQIGRRQANALHEISVHYLRHGHRRQAIYFHCRSLGWPGGWRFLSYTRHLLFNRA